MDSLDLIRLDSQPDNQEPLPRACCSSRTGQALEAVWLAALFACCFGEDIDRTIVSRSAGLGIIEVHVKDTEVSLASRLVIIAGLPGSGKTTLARRLEAEYPGVRMSADEWMTGLEHQPACRVGEDRIETLQWALAQRLLALGNIVVEWGTWGQWECDRLRLRAKELGAAVELHYFSAPLEELFRRIQVRQMEDPPIRWEAVQEWGSFFDYQNRHQGRFAPLPCFSERHFAMPSRRPRGSSARAASHATCPDLTPRSHHY